MRRRLFDPRLHNVYETLQQAIAKLVGKGVQIASERLQRASSDAIGTMDQYAAYREVIEMMRNSKFKFGTWFNPKTPKKVQRILDEYRRSGEMLRVFYGDAETGRDWMEEYDMIGTIGRSTGVMQIPLLVSKGEGGGPGLLDDCIIRIIDVESGKELYRHAKYHQPEMEICASGEAGYTHSVKVGGKTYSNHRSCGSAAALVAFLSGDSMCQPS